MLFLKKSGEILEFIRFLTKKYGGRFDTTKIYQGEIRMIGLAFFVYKRPKHTKEVIESIKRNHFEKIYIFQDGLKEEKDKQSWEDVTELIKGIDFTETEIHISKKNKGLANSIIEGMNYVFERHETAIALEDDIVLAEGYKSLAETLFEKYRNNKKVMSICGGGYGAIIPQTYMYDIYFSYRMSSLAFGTWKDRWLGFERDPRTLMEIYQDSSKIEMLQWSGNDIEKMVFLSMRGEIDTWATYWQIYMINQKGYHVIPAKGYATDVGRGGDGTNTTNCTYRYDVMLDGRQKESYYLPKDVFVDGEIKRDTKDLMNIAENKFQCYFDILCMWMQLYQQNLSTLNFFKDKKIYRIYIYGCGKIAGFLHYDISPDVKIAGYVVENKTEQKYCGIKIFDMKDNEGMESIPIVVTPSYDIAFIRHFFTKNNIKNEIILIEDILEYVFKNNGDKNNEKKF